MKKYFIIASILLLAASCSKQPATVINYSTPTSTPTAAPTPEQTNESASLSQQPGWQLEGENILTYDSQSQSMRLQRGTYKNGIITIKMRAYTVTFPGNIKNLDFTPIDTDTFTYDGIDVSHYLGIGNSVEQPGPVSYDCKSRITPAVGSQNFYYCKTNYKDTINDFEYTPFNSIGFGTGGGDSITWKKIYSRKAQPTPLFVVAELVDPGRPTLEDVDLGELATACVNDSYYQDCVSRHASIQNELKKYSSSSYLDGLLKDQQNKDLVIKADSLFNSITISAGGLDQ